MRNNQTYIQSVLHNRSWKIFKVVVFTSLRRNCVPFLSGLMACMIFGMPLLSFAQQNSVVAEAIADAKLNATARTNNLTWFAFGCLGGPLSVPAAFIKTAPSPELLLGKSPGYVNEYTKTYKSKTRNIRLKYAGLGFLSSVTVGGLLFYLRYDIADWIYLNL